MNFPEVLHQRNPSHHDSQLCSRCQTLDFDDLTRHELPRSHPMSFALGSLSEIEARASECALCNLVVHAIRAAWKGSSATTIDEDLIQCRLRNRAVGILMEDAEPSAYSENFAANAYRHANCRITILCDGPTPEAPPTAEIQLERDDIELRGLFDDLPLFSRRPEGQLSTVNVGLLGNWFSYCKRFHGPRRASLATSARSPAEQDKNSSTHNFLLN